MASVVLLVTKMNNNNQRHAVLWGIPKGKAGALNERPLIDTRSHPKWNPAELVEHVKGLASKDGFHSFRIADDGAIDAVLAAPSFGQNVIA